MASRNQKKVSFKDAADSSPDSFSFAGLLSIQDQNPKGTPTRSHRAHPIDTDFAFSHTYDQIDPRKYPPADLLISNGKLVPQATAFQPKIGRPHRRGSSTATSPRRSKRSGDRNGAKEGSAKHKRGQRNQSKMERNTSESGFGWKLFKSFASPCRECKAIKQEAVKTPHSTRKL